MPASDAKQSPRQMSPRSNMPSTRSMVDSKSPRESLVGAGPAEQQKAAAAKVSGSKSVAGNADMISGSAARTPGSRAIPSSTMAGEDSTSKSGGSRSPRVATSTTTSRAEDSTSKSAMSHGSPRAATTTTKAEDSLSKSPSQGVARSPRNALSSGAAAAVGDESASKNAQASKSGWAQANDTRSTSSREFRMSGSRGKKFKCANCASTNVDIEGEKCTACQGDELSDGDDEDFVVPVIVNDVSTAPKRVIGRGTSRGVPSKPVASREVGPEPASLQQQANRPISSNSLAKSAPSNKVRVVSVSSGDFAKVMAARNADTDTRAFLMEVVKSHSEGIQKEVDTDTADMEALGLMGRNSTKARSLTLGKKRGM